MSSRTTLVIAVAAVLILGPAGLVGELVGGAARGVPGSGAVPARGQDAPSSAAADGKGAAAKDDSVKGDEVKGLIEQLGSKDYKAREKAYQRLRDLGEKVRPALYEALRSENPEVVWNVSRLLDELDALREGGLRRLGRDDGRGAEERLRGLSEELDRLLEELQRGRPGMLWRDRGIALDPRFEEFFGPSWRSLMDRLDRFGRGFFVQPLGPGGRADITVSRADERGEASLHLIVGEDGKVRAEVKRDGEEQVIEADSVEAFRREHAAILEEFGVSGFGLQSESEPSSPSVVQPPQGPSPGLRRLGPLEPRALDSRGRLGVTVQAVPEVLAHHLRLEVGAGLLVEGVQPGSLAENVGVRRFDVLLSVNGRPIHSPEDVATALEGLAEGSPVEVKVIREGEERTLREAQ
ncbi:MAG: PDZ domain-containing protein [Planctomycetota bacterium]